MSYVHASLVVVGRLVVGAGVNLFRVKLNDGLLVVVRLDVVLRVVVGRLVVVLLVVVGLLVVVDIVVVFLSRNPLRLLKISLENDDSAVRARI